jgi:hypothetical protein
VTGVIDGVAFEGDQYYVHGWACQEGNRGSIGVNIYANHPAGGTPPGTYILHMWIPRAVEPSLAEHEEFFALESSQHLVGQRDPVESHSLHEWRGLSIRLGSSQESNDYRACRGNRIAAP